MRNALAILILFLSGPVISVAAENISAFDVRISVSENATIEVIENIVYDFGETERHGIFRRIPYSYQAGNETYTAQISSVVVTDEKGTRYLFNESRGRGELTLKIGDPDATITGQHTYIISYTVEGPFLYFEDYDELYWNVNGSWPTGIARASVLVDLPVGAKVLRASCYQGGAGTNNTCTSDERLVNTERAGYHAVANNLAPEEGFTVAIAFPKGMVIELENPWREEKRRGTLAFWPLIIPFVVLLSILHLWYTRGRDPEGRSTIVTEFTPPADVPPSVAGIVYNERIEPREISAELVRLAVEGYIKIHRTEKEVLVFTMTDYLFERLDLAKRPDDPIAALILDKLFQSSFEDTAEVEGHSVKGALLSKMQHKFVDEKEVITDAMYTEVLENRYFVERPDKVRQWYVGAGIGIIIAGIALAVFLSGFTAALSGVAVTVSGALVALGGILMPARTQKGVRLKEHLEGFKRYLSVAEKDRLAFHNAPERTPELFDKYLPYAMAFGVENEWAKQFKDLYTVSPSWYSGSQSERFALTALASELNTFSADFTAASAPKSSGSSGSGSVGGGFGGGGGGSW